MKRKITRRTWAAMVAGTAVPFRAQETRPAAKPVATEAQAQAKPAAPSRSEQLRKFKLSSSVEPAFIFKP